MNITFATTFPSIDIKYWSGTVFFMAKNLEKKASVDYITNMEDVNPLSLKLKRRLFNRNKVYYTDRSPEVGKGYAKEIIKRMSSSSDIVFSPSSIPLTYLDVKQPKVFYTDSTFSSMIGYYNWFDNACSRYIKEGIKAERKSLENCNLAIYSSHWAAESAINDYGINPQKVKVVPFGANIHRSLLLDDIKDIIKKRDPQICKILFLGVEWQRKGADIVVEAVKILNDMGLPTELHMVGLPELPINEIPPYIKNHGFISKATNDGLKKIEDLIQSSHFLFVPSRAEAYGVVFSEAMSLGVPCISAKTGGIPSIVKNELNGIILDLDAKPREYAKNIYNTYSDKNYYNKLSLSAFNDFETRLNWDVAMDTIIKYMKGL
ncbi:glycosyltransferase family 4 protein [Dysgonomonas sp. Marseille-P4677]|uniref:glycosyltransferase family 4 protein n=1 Tax=Dysgonomonas sp. Marseille-P4677 TaxID=2364790 RepID=UPI001914CD97|nr:glycosyltransferase family 4 protein [Dysgonomonas sp. Marseille-P4677]MBK5720240.1 glycosyltransferase family 4 protein [Dysgonomonas sp. Marseille-P4677]